MTAIAERTFVELVRAPMVEAESPLQSQRLALQACGLGKHFGDVVAVNNISLNVRYGEVFGFLGPNGAGKTTTISMILGLLAPTSGSIQIFGHELRGNESELLRRVGSLVEMPTFYPYMGARDNLMTLARLVGGVSTAAINALLDLVGLCQAADRPYRTYSLGMKQRLGIAGALIGEPELVILDEPTNGLDPAGIVQFRSLVRVLADEGRAVLLSSHQLNEVQQVCDRVAIVHAGTVVTDGLVGSLLQAQQGMKITVSDVERALDILADLTWVRTARVEHGAIVITGEAPGPFALGEALARCGVWIGRAQRIEGSLEHLFLNLTQPSDKELFSASNGATGGGAHGRER